MVFTQICMRRHKFARGTLARQETDLSLPIHHGVGSWMELTAPCFTSHWCDTLWVAHFAFTSNFFRCCNMACSRILTVAGSDEPTSAPAEAVLELHKCDVIEHIEIPCSCRASGCWWPYSVGHWPTWTRTWLQISGQGGNVTEGTAVEPRAHSSTVRGRRWKRRAKIMGRRPCRSWRWWTELLKEM